ncbi:mitochondrial carrier protein [Ceratobasidium sp. AG-Ba]|nr:mitochondrial carrier protein [Ceratobasidium sp. AG-Ba]
MGVQREPGQGVSWSNIAVGATMNMFVSAAYRWPTYAHCLCNFTLTGGYYLRAPLEVLKTQMAANRKESMFQALKTVWSRGGVAGFYQGLIPWAWIEASTKGVLQRWSSWWYDRGYRSSICNNGFLYLHENGRNYAPQAGAAGIKPPSTWAVFADIYRREGLAGINKGVNAVALRQMTNWGSRIGFARLVESSIRKVKGKAEGDKLDLFAQRDIGGALATWNQPIEVVRVEMQSMSKNAVASANRPAKLTVFNTLAFIYRENGIKGLYRGITPRIGLVSGKLFAWCRSPIMSSLGKGSVDF